MCACVWGGGGQVVGGGVGWGVWLGGVGRGVGAIR